MKAGSWWQDCRERFEPLGYFLRRVLDRAWDSGLAGIPVLMAGLFVAGYGLAMISAAAFRLSLLELELLIMIRRLLVTEFVPFAVAMGCVLPCVLSMAGRIGTSGQTGELHALRLMGSSITSNVVLPGLIGSVAVALSVTLAGSAVVLHGCSVGLAAHNVGNATDIYAALTGIDLWPMLVRSLVKVGLVAILGTVIVAVGVGPIKNSSLLGRQSARVGLAFVLSVLAVSALFIGLFP